MLLRPSVILLGLALLVASLFAEPAQSWPHEHSDIPVSPRVTWGRLDNGLRFALLPNRTPPGLVSLRLLVLAGALHERGDERGYAHFVEHMAFNGTRNFPAGELVKFLQRSGAAFGPHVNAETTETHTLYKLDLPENSAAALESGLRVLRDFADGVLFEPAEVNRERGVLLSESLTRRTPDLNREVAWREFVLAGTLVPQRLPLGTDAAIKGAKPAALRAFYDAWYRPERMIVTMVGDFDAAKLAPLVQTTFGSLAGRGALRPESGLGALKLPAGVSAKFYPEPRDGFQVELGTVRVEELSADTAQNRRKALSLELANAMLGHRLQRLTEQAEQPISAYTIEAENLYRGFYRFAVTTVGNTDLWTGVLAMAEQELRRALETGFDPTELAVAKAAARANEVSMAQSVATAPSQFLAGMLVGRIEQDRVFVYPDESLPRVLANLDQISAAECQRALRDAWGDSARYIFAAAAPQLASPSPQQILKAYETSRTVALTPPAALAAAKFAYEDFGRAGSVVQKEHVADLDVWLIRFANGVRLNLRRTDHERGRVQLRLRFGPGRLGEPADQPGLALWTGGVVAGGVGRHTDEELRQALQGRNFELSSGNADDALVFSGMTPAEHLPDFLRLIAAYMTDPAFRPAGNQQMHTVFSGYYSAMRQSASGVIAQQIVPFLGGGDSHLGFPPREVVERYSMEKLAAWLRPTLQSAAIEITLVGDFDVEQAIAEMAKTFGALPPRTAKLPLAERRQLKFPVPPKDMIYTYPLANRPTTLLLDWPVHDELSPAQQRRLKLLAAVLEDRLRVQIREEKGETYSPSASFNWSDVYPGFADLRCQLDVKTKLDKRVMDQVRDLAAALGAKGVTDEELQRAKAQAAAGVRQQLRDNGYWLETLSDAQERPWRIEAARTIESDYASATKAELDALATRYLTSKNLFRFILKPVPPKS